MNDQSLRDWIDSLTADIEFKYNGVWGSICPFNRSNISLCYGDYEITVHSIDEAMNTPFIDGKTLSQISEQLEI